MGKIEPYCRLFTCAKPLVSRYVHCSGVATCQDVSILVNGGYVSTRDSKKGLRRVLI